MKASQRYQAFLDAAKDAIDKHRTLTPSRAIEALDDIIEYAQERRFERTDERVKSRRRS